MTSSWLGRTLIQLLRAFPTVFSWCLRFCSEIRFIFWKKKKMFLKNRFLHRWPSSFLSRCALWDNLGSFLWHLPGFHGHWYSLFVLCRPLRLGIFRLVTKLYFVFEKITCKNLNYSKIRFRFRENYLLELDSVCHFLGRHALWANLESFIWDFSDIPPWRLRNHSKNWFFFEKITCKNQFSSP